MVDTDALFELEIVKNNNSLTKLFQPDGLLSSNLKLFSELGIQAIQWNELYVYLNTGIYYNIDELTIIATKIGGIKEINEINKNHIFNIMSPEDDTNGAYDWIISSSQNSIKLSSEGWTCGKIVKYCTEHIESYWKLLKKTPESMTNTSETHALDLTTRSRLNEYISNFNRDSKNKQSSESANTNLAEEDDDDSSGSDDVEDDEYEENIAEDDDSSTSAPLKNNKKVNYFSSEGESESGSDSDNDDENKGKKGANAIENAMDALFEIEEQDTQESLLNDNEKNDDIIDEKDVTTSKKGWFS